MFRFVGCIFSVLMLFSCTNDLDTINRITIKSTDPDERIQNLELFFTDSGFAKVRIFAKIAEMYTQPITVTKLKDSICVFFYTPEGKVETILTGRYGEYFPKENRVFIQNHVVLENLEKSRKMETEELFWKQADSSIYTNRLVTITTPDGKFYGDGIKAKQDFSTYEFIHPRGKITKKKDGDL